MNIATPKQSVLFAAVVLLFFSTLSEANRRFENLDIEDGLSQNTISSIIQDDKGYMWFGTYDGLNRYDGHDFEAYHHSDPDGLVDNFIVSMLKGDNDSFWIGTFSGGLNLFDQKTKTFTRYQHDKDNPDSLSHNYITSLIKSSDGHLWIGTYGGGINIFDKETKKFKRILLSEGKVDSSNYNTINHLLRDNNGDIWIGTYAGLFVYQQRSGEFKHYPHVLGDDTSLSANIVLSLVQDSKNVIWVGTQGGGLNRYNKAQDNFTHYKHQPNQINSISNDIIKSLIEDDKNRLWIATANGLTILDSERKVFERIYRSEVDKHSICGNAVDALYKSKNNIIWISCFTRGISKYNVRSEQFGHVKNNHNRKGSLSSNNVWGFLEDSLGYLWIATDGGGLNRKDQKTGEYKAFIHEPNNDNSLTNNRVWAVIEDSPNVYWVGMEKGGLNRLDLNTGKVRRFFSDMNNPSQGPIDDFVINLLKDSEGLLWVGTYKGLSLYDIEKDYFFQFKDDKDNPHYLNSVGILYMMEDSKNNIWIGTFGTGLVRYDRKTKKFTVFRYDPEDKYSLRHDKVSAIYEDTNHRIWVTSLNSGLMLFDRETEQFHEYAKEHGLLNRNLYGVLESDSGDLWVSSNFGVSRFDIGTLKFTNYSIADGLQSNEFNTGAFLKTKKGELLFGGINGFNQFNPEKLVEPDIDLSVVITNMRVFNEKVGVHHLSKKDNQESQNSFMLDKNISFETAIELSYRENLFSFEFSSLVYSAPASIEYAYFLENWQDSWVYTDSSSRRATFTNIPPGKYQLKIKAGIDNKWSEYPTQLNIVITPPPWKTWWAYCLYTLVTLCLTMWIVQHQRLKVEFQRLQLSKEKELNTKLTKIDKMKDDFLANTSHELRTPLNGMIGLAESMIDGTSGKLPQDALTDLKLMVKSGYRLSNLVNDVLDFSKMKNAKIELNHNSINLYLATKRVIELSLPLINDKPLKILNEIPTDLINVFADENRLQQILFNLIGNAIKFTKKGVVRVSAKKLDEANVEVSISDSGIGIAESEYDNIFKSFQQGSGTISREYSGTGLGLTLTKMLVELHGGKIGVTSEEGLGSQFYFTLPTFTKTRLSQLNQKQGHSDKACIKQEMKKVESLAFEGEEVTVEPQKASAVGDKLRTDQVMRISSKDLQTKDKARILIVDDDLVNRRVIQKQLFGRGFQLFESFGGRDAIERFAKGEQYDLVLLDIMMPNVSGYDVCEYIRKTYSINELPIIFLTAKGQIDDLENSFNLGVNDYITKPIRKKELVSRVELHLELLKINNLLQKVVSEKTKNAKTISDVGRLITAGFDIDKTLARVYRGIKLLMVVDVFEAGFISHDKENLQCYFGDYRGTHFKPHDVTMADKTQLPICCLESKQPILIRDLDLELDTETETAVKVRYPDTKFDDIRSIPCMDIDGEERASIQSVIYVPIVAGDDVLGLFSVKSERKNQLTGEHVEMLESIASYMAVALKNVAMNEQMLLVEKEKADEISRQKKLVEIATQSKSQFLATMSHEIRTPMNGVLGMVELLRDTLLDEKQRFYLDIIHRSGESLVEIINDILDYSKIESGKIDLECIPFNLEELIEDCIQLFSAIANRKSIELIGVVSPDVPIRLSGDPTRLRQVLFNLIGNAFKFTETGYIALSASLTSIISDGKVKIQFSIIDTGIGVAHADRSKLFESFTQADTLTTRKYGGTGLGLAISKKIVELMGGEIGVVSDGNKGSDFWFTANLALDESPKTASELAADKNLRDNLLNQKLLLMSYDEKVPALLKSHLVRWGIKAEVLSPDFSHSNAMDDLVRKLDIFDLVLIDNKLIHGVGVDVIRKVRALMKESKPILLYHFESESIGIAEAESLNIQKIIAKPIVPRKLVETLVEVITHEKPSHVLVKERQSNYECLSLSHLNIIVAEDNETNQLVIKGLLKKHGILPKVVNNGLKAVEAVKQSKTPVDFIFMDCEMPEMDGFQATHEIRKFEKESNLAESTISALSAHALNEHRQLAYESGMNYYLFKPVRMKDIVSVFLQTYQTLDEWRRLHEPE